MMKAIIFLALLGLAVAKVDYTGFKVFRAHPTLTQFETIKTLKEKYDLDVWSDFRHEGDFIDFMVSPTVQPIVEETMRYFRIQYETFIEDVEEATRAQIISSQGDFTTAYLTFDQIMNWMDGFASANSGLVSVMQANDASYEGRPISYLQIGSKQGTAARSFFMTCGIHSREWITPAACINMANMYIQDYSKNATIRTILDNIDIYIVPVANPDGYEYTWTGDRMWRKTRSTGNCNVNCVGADPNRNYDSNWCGEGASSNCCTDTYCGPSPFSEVETYTQANLVANLGNVKGYIDIHAYSQYWMIPYGYTNTHCKDYDFLNKMARDCADAIKTVHGKTYESGAISDVIYVASGSSADFFYDGLGVKCSFAAELRDRGRYGFQLPADQIIPTAEETYEGLNIIAKAIQEGKCD